MVINNAAWFFIGATLGSSISIGVTYIYMRDRFEKKLDEEITALRTHYIDRDKELAKKNEERKKELEERIYSPNEIQGFVDYTNMYSPQTTDSSIISYKEVVNEVPAAAEIISAVDWDDPNFDEYRKITVDYFENGAVFESLSGEEIDGFESIAGSDWKDAFGEYTPNTVYVRNHELKTDYEIIEQEGSFPSPEDE